MPPAPSLRMRLGPNPAWPGSLADWSRWIAVDDGSTFDGAPDFFLDAAIPRSQRPRPRRAGI